MFLLLPCPLPVSASALGLVMAGASLSSVSMDSQQSLNSLAKSLYQELRLLDTPAGVQRRSGLRRCLRGRTGVVCETVERVVLQDRGYRMANTKTPVTQEPARCSRQGIDEALNPGLQSSQRSGTAVDLGDSPMIRSHARRRHVSDRRVHTCGHGHFGILSKGWL